MLTRRFGPDFCISTLAFGFDEASRADSQIRKQIAFPAVGDTNGIFFDKDGRQVDHALNQRTIALGFEPLKALPVIILIAGQEKARAAKALLHSGIVNGLIIDGDAAAAVSMLG